MSCFDYGEYQYLSRVPFNARVVRVHFGTLVCRNWPNRIVSSHPHMTAEIYGMGDAFGVNVSGVGAWIVALNSATVQFHGHLLIKQCLVARTWFCSLSTSVDFEGWYTAGPNVGPNGWWSHTSRDDTRVWSTP